MPQELYIQRDTDITLEEWKAAVAATEGTQLDEADIVAKNPRTGAEIKIPGKPGSVRVFSPAEDKWIQVFRYSAMGIFFHAPDDWEDESCYLRPTAFALAEKLGAEIVGDDEDEE